MHAKEMLHVLQLVDTFEYALKPQSVAISIWSQFNRGKHENPPPPQEIGSVCDGDSIVVAEMFTKMVSRYADSKQERGQIKSDTR